MQMSNFYPAKTTHKQIIKSSQPIEITDYVIASPGGKMGEFNLANPNPYNGISRVKRIGDQIHLFAKMINTEHEKNNFHDIVYDMFKEIANGNDVEAAKKLKEMCDNSDSFALDMLRDIIVGEKSNTQLSHSETFNLAIKEDKFDEAITLLKQSNKQLIDDIKVKPRNDIPLDKTMKPDSLHKVSRTAFCEFSFYTPNTPLSLEEYHQILLDTEQIAKECRDNVTLLLGSFAVKTANDQVHNMVVHVLCGNNPDINHFAKLTPSSIDAVYPGTTNPSFLGKENYPKVLLNKLKINLDEKKFDEVITFIDTNKDKPLLIDPWLKKLRLDLLADLDNPPQTSLIQIIDSMLEKTGLTQDIEESVIKIFKDEMKNFKDFANAKYEFSGVDDRPNIFKGSIEFKDVIKNQDITYISDSLSFTFKHADICNQLLSFGSSYKFPTWALDTLTAIQKRINECNASGFPADNVNNNLVLKVQEMITKLTTFPPKLEVSDISSLQILMSTNSIQKTTEYKLPFETIRDFMEKFSNTYNFPSFGLEGLKALKKMINDCDAVSINEYKSDPSLILHIDDMISKLSTNTPIPPLDLSTFTAKMNKYKNDCLDQYEIRVHPKLIKSAPDIGKTKLQSTAKSGNDLILAIESTLQGTDINNPRKNQLAKMQIAYLHNALFFPHNDLKTAIRVIENKFFLQDKLNEVEILLDLQKQLITKVSNKSNPLDDFDKSDIHKIAEHLIIVQQELKTHFPGKIAEINNALDKCKKLLQQADFTSLIKSVSVDVAKLIADTDNNIKSEQHLLILERLRNSLIILRGQEEDKYKIDVFISHLDNLVTKLATDSKATLDKSDLVIFKVTKKDDLDNFLSENTIKHQIDDSSRDDFKDGIQCINDLVNALKVDQAISVTNISDLKREMNSDNSKPILDKIEELVSAPVNLLIDLELFKNDHTHIDELITNPILLRNPTFIKEIQDISLLGNNSDANIRRKNLVDNINKWFTQLDEQSKIQGEQLIKILNNMATIQEISAKGVKSINEFKEKIISGQNITTGDVSTLKSNLQPFNAHLNKIQYWHYPTSTHTEGIVYNSTILCKTVDKQQYLSTTSICLDNRNAFGMRNFYNTFNNLYGRYPIGMYLSESVTSASVSLLRSHIVDKESSVLHADSVTELSGKKTSSEIDERLMGVRNVKTGAIVPIQEISDEAKTVKWRDTVNYPQTTITKTTEEIVIDKPFFGGEKLVMRKYEPQTLKAIPFNNTDRATPDTQAASFYVATINRFLDFCELPSNAPLQKQYISEFRIALGKLIIDPNVDAEAIFREFDKFKKNIVTDASSEDTANLLKQINAIEKYLNTKMISLELYITKRLIPKLDGENLTVEQKQAIVKLKLELELLQKPPIQYDDAGIPIVDAKAAAKAIHDFMTEISKYTPNEHLNNVSNQIEELLQSRYPKVQDELVTLYESDKDNNAKNYFQRRMDDIDRSRKDMQHQITSLENSQRNSNLKDSRKWQIRDESTESLETGILAKLSSYLDTHKPNEISQQFKTVAALKDELLYLKNATHAKTKKPVVITSDLINSLLNFKKSIDAIKPPDNNLIAVYTEIVSDLEKNHKSIHTDLIKAVPTPLTAKSNQQSIIARKYVVQEYEKAKVNYETLKEKKRSIPIKQKRVKEIDTGLPIINEKLELITKECDHLDIELREMKSKLEKLGENKNGVKQQQTETQEKRDKLLEQIKELDSNFQKNKIVTEELQYKLLQEHETLKKLKLTQSGLEDTLSELKENMSNKELKVQQATSVLSQTNEHIKDLEKQIQQNELLHKEYKQSSVNSHAQYAELENKLLELDSHHLSLQEDIQKNQNLLEVKLQNQKDFGEITEENAEKANLLSAEIRKLQETIELSKNEASEINKQIINNQQAILKLKEAERLQLSKAEERSEIIISLNKQHEATVLNLKEQESKILLLKNEISSDKDKSINLSEEIINHTELIASKTNELQLLETDILKKREQLKNMQEESELKTSESQQLQIQIEDFDKQLSGITIDQESQQQKINEKSLDLDGKLIVKSDTTKLHQSLVEEKATLEKELKSEEFSLPKINEQLADADEKYRSLQDQMERHKQQQENLVERVKQDTLSKSELDQQHQTMLERRNKI